MIIIKTAVFLLAILRCLFHKPTVLLVFAIRNVWFLLSPSWVFHEVFLVFGTMNARKMITLSTKILLWFSWKALHDPTSIITPPSLPGWPCVKNLHMWHFHFLLSSPPALTTSLGASCRRAIPTLAAGQEAAAQVLSPLPRRLSWNLQSFNVSLMMIKKYPPLHTYPFKSTGSFPWSRSTVLTRFMRTDTSFGGPQRSSVIMLSGEGKGSALS